MENESFYYCIPYVISLFFLLLLSFLDIKTKGVGRSYVRIISVCFIIWYFGLRGFVGSDFTSYYLFYQNVPNLSEFSFKESTDAYFEPGFVFFSSIIKSISDSYHFFVFFNTIFDIGLLLIIFKRYCNEYFVFSIAIFFVFGGELEINLLRNIKSILFFLISLKYLRNRKMLPYLLLNVICLTFHATAIFFLPLYFFLHKISKRVFLSIFIIGFGFYFLQIKYISLIVGLLSNALGGIYLLKATDYLESDNSGITLAFIYVLVPFLLIYKNYDTIVSRNNYNVLFVNLFLFYSVANLFFTEILVFRSRFGALFVMSLCVVLPQILLCYENKKLKYYSVNFLILVLLVSRIVLLNTPLPNVYDNLTFGIMSYEKRISNFNQFSGDDVY